MKIIYFNTNTINMGQWCASVDRDILRGEKGKRKKDNEDEALDM